MGRVRTALIVGGGVAGPASALALAKIGIRSTVVESHPGPAAGVGAIITVAPNGFDVLRTLGVADDIAAAAQLTSEVRMSDAAGHAFARFPGGGHVMPRDALASILAAEAQRIGSRVEYGRRLIGLAADPDGVQARFADDTTVTADILVGADGIHSTVRRLIDSSAPSPLYEGVLGFGAAVDSPDTDAEPGVMNFAFGRHFLGYWRLPDGRVCWYAALPHEEQLDWRDITGTARSEWLSALRSAYRGLIPAEGLLAATDADDLVPTGPTLRMPSVPRWHRDRAVLVGDSAHAPSSTSGQGASLALESALDLARCIRDLPDLAAAFAVYEQIRRPRVEAVAESAAAANRGKAGKIVPGEKARVPFDATGFRIRFDEPVNLEDIRSTVPQAGGQ